MFGTNYKKDCMLNYINRKSGMLMVPWVACIWRIRSIDIIGAENEDMWKHGEVNAGSCASVRLMCWVSFLRGYWWLVELNTQLVVSSFNWRLGKPFERPLNGSLGCVFWVIKVWWSKKVQKGVRRKKNGRRAKVYIIEEKEESCFAVRWVCRPISKLMADLWT